NEVRSASLLNVDQGVERHHVAVLVADIEFPNLVGLMRELWVSLEEDFKHAAEADAIVHVKPTQVRLHRLEDAVPLHPDSSRFFAVDRYVHLRRSRLKRRR